MSTDTDQVAGRSGTTGDETRSNETIDMAPTMAACWAVGTAGPGSPGASTLALVLAIHAEALLVEADPDGGVMGARCGCYLHEAAPSLASLLAALPAGVNPSRLVEHTQLLPSGIRAALLGPAGEDAAGPVGHLPHALDALRQGLPGGRVVLDVGRVRPNGPAMQLVGQVDATVIVTGASVDGLACVLARLPVLAASTPALVVAVRGSGPYTLDDIRAEIHARAGEAVEVIWVPDDPRCLTSLLTSAPQPRGRRGWLPSNGPAPLLRAATDLYSALMELTMPATSGQDTGGALA